MGISESSLFSLSIRDVVKMFLLEELRVGVAGVWSWFPFFSEGSFGNGRFKSVALLLELLMWSIGITEEQ